MLSPLRATPLRFKKPFSKHENTSFLDGRVKAVGMQLRIILLSCSRKHAVMPGHADTDFGPVYAAPLNALACWKEKYPLLFIAGHL